jgi:carbon storage regulator
MLVLTRKSNQSIMIGDNIEVSVLAIMGEKVRIGIQADRSVPVFRKEVYLEIQAERGDEANGEASAEPAGDAQSEAESPAADGASDEPTNAGGPHDEATSNGRRAVDAALRSINGESK